MKETAEITVDSVESSDRLSDDLCPFIKFPGSDCYCLNIDSEHIGCMDDFCVGRYLECPLFKKNLQNRCWPERL